MPDHSDENAAFEAAQQPDPAGSPAPRPAESGTPEYPELGERDGRFYFHKDLEGQGEIPDQTHQDCLRELVTVARNTGYLVEGDGNPMVDQAQRTDQGWHVTYSVAVRDPDTQE